MIIHRSRSIRAMMMTTAIGCLVALPACSKLDSTKSNSTGGTKAVANLTAPANEPVVVYERETNAFGTSSAYTRSIYANGKLIYKPIPVSTMPIYADKKTPEKTTPTERQLTQEDLQKILAEFDRANFLSMKDSYATSDDGCPRVVSDQGGASITFNGATVQKKVDHYLGCAADPNDIGKVYPPELGQLEYKLDELVPKQP